MTFSYRLLIRLLVPFIFIYLWVRGKKAPAYWQRWSERLALQNIPPQARDGMVIHCVSVGETVAARGLIEQLLQRYPYLPITVTSMTPTAAELALKLFGDRVFHSYLPIDTPAAMQRFFDKLAPRFVLILETELWPCFLHQAKQRAIPVVVANARLSEKSAASYQKYQWLVGPIWSSIDFIAAQTAASVTRFIKLGVPAERIAMRGNLKHDFQVSEAILLQAQQWRAQLNRPILLAASTHEGEDEQVLAAFSQVLKQHPNTLLILVPRHPERFDKVAERIAKQGLNYVRRSTAETVSAQQQVFLGDTMGELLLWCAVADIAWVGGSLIQRGGHNPLEPVATGTAVVSGPHVFNFQEIYDRLQQAQAVCMVANAQELAATWITLLDDGAKCRMLAERARAEFAHDQGATAAIVGDISKRIEALTSDTRLADKYIRTLLMMKTEQPNQATHIWFEPEVLNECPNDYFEPAYWQQLNKVKGSATGRSTAWFIDAGEQGLLLRHYYRGGLVGKVNKDRFKREPVASSRAMAEFALLLKLRELQLPVPRPVAARYTQASLWGYRADILVEVIPNAQDVFKTLQQRALAPKEWEALGQAIKQLHQHQVYHSDLNCHNLMLDEQGKAWIVDFDKCGFREPGEWEQGNLQRLLRSFKKELAKSEEANQAFHWNETRDWPLLTAAYSRI